MTKYVKSREESYIGFNFNKMYDDLHIWIKLLFIKKNIARYNTPNRLFLNQLAGLNHIHLILKFHLKTFMLSLSVIYVIKINNQQVISILLGWHVNIMLNPVTTNNVIFSLKWIRSMWQSQRILEMISGKSIFGMNS